MPSPLRLLLIVFMSALLAPTAAAHPQFQKQFQEHYLADHPDEEFSKFVKRKARCWVCHQGRKRTNYNTYGKHFIGLLTEDDKKDVEKIVAALEQVGQLAAVESDDQSPTFDQLIAASKLPAGELETLKQDPPEAETDCEPPAE